MEKALLLKFLIRSKFNFKKTYEYYRTYDTILKLGLFDKAFYLKKYPHVEESRIDPLEHFLFYGFDEGKYPGPFFNIDAYMDENPEIKINPLVHYVLKNSKGLVFTNSPVKTAKDRLIQTNSLFLHNYTFKEEPFVSIIVLNRNGSKHLKRLFKNFDDNIHYDHYEIIIVDNNSSDDSIEVLKGLSKVLPITIIENKENVSFSKGNNDAAKIAKGDYLLLLNNDIEPTYGWLNEMMGTMLSNENVGAVGAKLVFPYDYNGKHKATSFSIQHAGVKFLEANNPYIYSPYHEHMFFNQIFDKRVNETKECISNTAAALLIPKKTYFELDGLDEDYFYGYEDIDFAFKLFINGYKSIYCASAMLFHYESATRIKDEKVEKTNFNNIMYFKNKWDNVLFVNFLKDKINHEYFFTDKKLAISIFSEDYNNKYVSNLLKNFLDMKYNSKILSDITNYNLHSETDIFISFSPKYNAKKIVARLNLIKILVLENLENLEYIREYDIILTFDKDIADKIKNQYLHDNVFIINKNTPDLYKNNSKEIIDIVKNVYLE